MNYFTQKRVLVTLIIILVLINFSVLAVIIGFFYSSGEQHLGKPPLPPPPPSIRTIMTSGLKLTPEQRIHFKEASSRFMNRSGNILRQYYRDKRMMFDLLAQPEPDSSLIIRLTDTLGMQQAHLERITVAYFLELQRVCTPKQRMRFPGIFQQMLHRMSMPDPMPAERYIPKHTPAERRVKRLKRTNY